MYREFIFHQNIPTNVSPTIGIAHVGFGKISLVKLCEIHLKCASLKTSQGFQLQCHGTLSLVYPSSHNEWKWKKIPLWRQASHLPGPHFSTSMMGERVTHVHGTLPNIGHSSPVDPEERQGNMTRIEIVEAMDGKPLRLASIMIPIEIWTQKNGEFSNTQSQISETQILLMVQKSS